MWEGAKWFNLNVTLSGTSCGISGQMIKNSTDYRFCNGDLKWVSMVGTVSDGSCTKAGEVFYDSTNKRFKWCDGTNWKLMQPSISIQLPNSLSYLQTGNGSMGGAMTWNAGANTGPCKIQYQKDGSTWTDAEAFANYDCSSNGMVSFNLPSANNWTNNFNATGVKLRLLGTINNEAFGEFTQRATCTVVGSPSSATPAIDENCNGIWNDELAVLPTSLALSHSANNRGFFVTWSAGSGNGGAGGCKLQYQKDGAVWTDISGTLNCDANAAGAMSLPSSDNWTNNFNSTGVTVRLVRVSDAAVMGTFANKVTCTSASASVSSTPDYDENCNGYWDENGIQQYGTCETSPTSLQAGTGYNCVAPASCSGYTSIEFMHVVFRVGGGNDFNNYSDSSCTTFTYLSGDANQTSNIYSPSGTVPTAGVSGRTVDGSCFMVNAINWRKMVTNLGWGNGSCTYSYGAYRYW